MKQWNLKTVVKVIVKLDSFKFKTKEDYYQVHNQTHPRSYGNVHCDKIS